MYIQKLFIPIRGYEYIESLAIGNDLLVIYPYKEL